MLLFVKKIAESKITSAEQEAKKVLELANIEAENKKKEEIFKAKEEIMNARKDLDAEIKERRGEVQVQERRIMQKEENLEKRSEMFEKKEKELERKHQELQNKQNELSEVFNRQMAELQRISGLSAEEAKKQLLTELEKQLVNEKAAIIKEMDKKQKKKQTKMQENL